jgi:signal transduction histidine kinase
VNVDDGRTANEPDEPTTEWLVNQIAHALRNPIFAALVQIEALALRGGQEPGIDKAADSVYKQLKRLEHNVNEMLLFGRPAKVQREPLDVTQLVNELVEAYRRGDREEAAEVTVTTSCDSLEARWDVAMVRTVLERLLDNAVQQTAAPHRISVHLSRSPDGQAVLSISDDGEGVAADLADRIFLPFFPQHRGRPGLGLAIAAKFTGLHGGTVSVASRPEGGAEARVLLPLDGPE